MGQCHHKGPNLTRDVWPLNLKAMVVRPGHGWQVSGRSTASLDCLLSKWSDSRSALPTDLYHKGPSLTRDAWPLILFGIHLAGTELLDSPVSTEFSAGLFQAVFIWLSMKISGGCWDQQVWHHCSDHGVECQWQQSSSVKFELPGL